MQKRGSIILSQKLYKLALGGGIAFWATTVATSLLPIAAEYRAAFSNWSARTVWVASLLAGLIIGCCVSYCLLRFFRVPTRNPVSKSVMLSCVALVMAIVLIDAPQSFGSLGPSDALHYFLIGVTFNAARYVTLGLTIGHSYKRLYGSA